MSAEENDELIIRFDDREFVMTRHNTALFTFAGELATRNHVFMETGEQHENVQIGSYIFQHSDSYQALFDFLIEHHYPMHLNLNEVAECDENAFQRSLDQLSEELEGDYVPDDWMTDGSQG